MRRHPLEEAADLLELVGVVERPVVGILVVGPPDGRVLGLLDQGLQERLVHPGPGQDAGGGRAVLPCIEVAGSGDALGRRGGICIVEHDDGCLAAKFQVDSLEGRSRGGGDLLVPARTEPVTDTMAGVSCTTRARPVSRDSPQTTLNTPGGRCSAMISAMRSVVTGVVSDGLSTMVLPAASAGANFHTAIIIG